MSLSELLQILQLLALAALVALLVRLVGEIHLLRSRLEIDREKKDGQIINVNLSPVALAETKETSAPTPRGIPEPIREPGPSPEPDPEPEPSNVPAPGSIRITPMGLGAVKCPNCGAENSTFRSECFSCGAALR